MPQRHLASAEIQHGTPKVRCVPEECRHRHVLYCPSHSEPRAHHEPHAASGPYEVSQSFAALDNAPVAARQHGFNRENVLKHHPYS